MASSISESELLKAVLKETNTKKPVFILCDKSTDIDKIPQKVINYLQGTAAFAIGLASASVQDPIMTVWRYSTSSKNWSVKEHVVNFNRFPEIKEILSVDNPKCGELNKQFVEQGIAFENSVIGSRPEFYLITKFEKHSYQRESTITSQLAFFEGYRVYVNEVKQMVVGLVSPDQVDFLDFGTVYKYRAEKWIISKEKVSKLFHKKEELVASSVVQSENTVKRKTSSAVEDNPTEKRAKRKAYHPCIAPTTAIRKKVIKECAWRHLFFKDGFPDPNQHAETSGKDRGGGFPLCSLLAVISEYIKTAEGPQKDIKVVWKHYSVCRMCTQDNLGVIMTSQRLFCFQCLTSEMTRNYCCTACDALYSVGKSYRDIYLSSAVDLLRHVYIPVYATFFKVTPEFRIGNSDDHGSLNKRFDMRVIVTGINVALLTGHMDKEELDLFIFIEVISSKNLSVASLQEKLVHMMRLVKYSKKFRVVMLVMYTMDMNQEEKRKGTYTDKVLQSVCVRMWVNALIMEVHNLKPVGITLITLGAKEFGSSDQGQKRKISRTSSSSDDMVTKSMLLSLANSKKSAFEATFSAVLHLASFVVPVASGCYHKYSLHPHEHERFNNALGERGNGVVNFVEKLRESQKYLRKHKVSDTDE